MIPRDPNPVTRAAFIAEGADGSRVFYEYVPGSIELEIEHEIETMLSRDGITAARQQAATLTVRGTLGRNIAWHGDMPTAAQDEITNRHELEPGRHQITRET